MTMLFPSHGSHIPMPCGLYCSMPYSCPLWSYNSWMPSPRYFCPDYITCKELVINEPSPANNDHFHHRDWSTQKKKHKVIKQVYRVKRDGRLNINSDLILEKEKPTIETSASSIDAPNGDHISNDIAEQRSSLARGQGKEKKTGNTPTDLTGSQDSLTGAPTGLTGAHTGLTGVSSKSGNSSKSKKKMRPSFKELLVKYKKKGAD